MTTTTIERVNAVNKVHRLINDTVPLLIDALKEGFKTKNDDTLYQKDKDRLNAILRTHKDYLDEVVTAHIDDRRGSVRLNVKSHWPVRNGAGCCYYNASAGLWNQTESPEHQQYVNHTRRILTLPECLEAEKQVRSLEDEIRALTAQHSKLVHDFKLLNGTL